MSPAATGETKIEEVEDAVLTWLRSALAPAVTDVAPVTQDDFDEDVIVTQPDAVRIAFREEALTTDDPHGFTYESRQNWLAFCGAQDLSTFEKERKGALGLLTSVKEALAGKILTLASNAQGALVKLGNASLYQIGPNGTWYALPFTVESVTQFTGNM